MGRYVMKGDILPDDIKKKISSNNAQYWLGKKRDLKTISKMSKGMRGKFIGSNHPKWKEKIQIICKQCRKKKSFYPCEIERLFCSMKCYGQWMVKNTIGKNNPAWKGNTNLNRLLRGRRKYLIWRKKVFERDNYTCQKCGAKSRPNFSVYIGVHHIFSFAKYPELRYKLDNGRTLCRKCHRKIHNGRMVR